MARVRLDELWLEDSDDKLYRRVDGGFREVSPPPPPSIIYPVGSYYVQYPDAASNTDSIEFPTSQRPATLFGGTWAEQWSTESVYFRTRGVLSDTGRTNGKQEDAVQVHRHFRLPSQVPAYDVSSGPVWMGQGGNNPNATTSGTTGGDNATGRASEDETRVVNRRIKVWKRTA